MHFPTDTPTRRPTPVVAHAHPRSCPPTRRRSAREPAFSDMVENRSLENKCSPTKVGYERGGFGDRREMGSQRRGVRGAVPTVARKPHASPRRAERAPLCSCPAPVSEDGSPGQTAAHPDSPLPFAPSSPSHRSAPPLLFTHVRSNCVSLYVRTYIRKYIRT